VRYVLDAVYLIALAIFSPWLLYKARTTGKYRRGLWCKLSGQAWPRAGSEPCVWFHGVSVGEIHLLRPIVARFRQRYPGWACVISTTTDTGYDEARKRFPDVPVFFWPLDFSWAVARALRRVRPHLVVLAEGELWPNFLATACEQGVRVAVVNGRLSPRSFRRYRRLGRITSKLLQCIDLLIVQTEDYARCFRRLGAAPERVCVAGSVKYDGVESNRANPRTHELRRLFGIVDDELVWVAGSTQEPEESLALAIYQRLKATMPSLRLILVPRQKERFDEVAALVERSGYPLQRRSQLRTPATDRQAVILVDTIGELGAVWGLADVAFVGGSLDGQRGGQNMIEPAAYGATVLFGPHVWNFRDTADRQLRAGAALQVRDAKSLDETVRELLTDATRRAELGQAAQKLVQTQQGATDRTLDYLEPLLRLRRSDRRRAA
jgi:3-deoxy-D-manno-octulosonic-acid transferase